jgi:GNAT superfamily N-acetyltransferase
MSSYEYFETTFENIYDLWNEGLWPSRVSKIESRSSLSWDARLWEGYGNIYITKNKERIWKYKPTFWVARSEGKLIGVNSGFKTNDDIYRSRGLYVSPEHRGVGVSKMLLKLTINSAKQGGCRIIWTMPRKSALPAYESVGFRKIGGWIDEGVEFGPNCIAINELL